jgi:hypothetical protein
MCGLFAHARGRGGFPATRPGQLGQRKPTRLLAVVLFFEILLVAAVVVITWFALYTLYRLITDES